MSKQVFDHEDERRPPVASEPPAYNPQLGDRIMVRGVRRYCEIVAIDSHWYLAKIVDDDKHTVLKVSYAHEHGLHWGLGIHYSDLSVWPDLP